MTLKHWIMAMPQATRSTQVLILQTTTWLQISLENEAWFWLLRLKPHAALLIYTNSASASLSWLPIWPFGSSHKPCRQLTHMGWPCPCSPTRSMLDKSLGNPPKKKHTYIYIYHVELLPSYKVLIIIFHWILNYIYFTYNY